MTPEMVSKARANARTLGLANVSFRLGEIEHLPVADASVDVILSNCVINLSPDKGAVFREAFRVLAPVEVVRQHLVDAGFGEISVAPDPASAAFIRDWVPGSGAENYVASAVITAVKPGGAAARPAKVRLPLGTPAPTCAPGSGCC